MLPLEATEANALSQVAAFLACGCAEQAATGPDLSAGDSIASCGDVELRRPCSANCGPEMLTGPALESIIESAAQRNAA